MGPASHSPQTSTWPQAIAQICDIPRPPAPRPLVVMWATDTAVAVAAAGQESRHGPPQQLGLGHLQDLRWQCWLLTSRLFLATLTSSWCTSLSTFFPYHLSTFYLVIIVAPSPLPLHARGHKGALQCLSDLACTTWMRTGAS